MATATAGRPTPAPPAISDGWFVRAGMAMADWCERWFPDAFVFALVGLIIVFMPGSSWNAGDDPHQVFR
jgi:hypothetical protein